MPTRFAWNTRQQDDTSDVPSKRRRASAPDGGHGAGETAVGDPRAVGDAHADEVPRPTAAISSRVVLEVENSMLKAEVKKLEAEVANSARRFTFRQISGDDKLVQYYTSLPSASLFRTLVTYVGMCKFDYHRFAVANMPLEDQLLMVLMKLRHNFGNVDMATRFAVSVGTVSNIFRTFVSLFAKALFEPVLAGKMPSREKNMTELPASFQKFKNCRSILDCTELRMEVPDSTREKSSTYSAYKSYNTFKVMIGVAPNGVINYVSPVYGGNASDRHIVQTSGILEEFVTGDLIIADKGFPVKDIVPEGVEVNTPAYLFNPQFTKHEVMHNREVAEARIHVERAIARLKLYEILDCIPAQHRDIIDSIVRACAILTTLQPRIIASHRLQNLANRK